MNTRMTCRYLTLAACAAAPLAQAAEGLAVPAPETLWPQWQARVAVHTGSLSPLTMSSLLAGTGPQRGLADGSPQRGLANGSPQRGLVGGSVLGGYTFARPSFGSFYASGGLLIGQQGGASLSSVDGLAGATAGPRLGTAVNNLGALSATPFAAPGADTPGTVPYLGLGFTGAAWRNSLAFTADVGMVAEHASAASGVGRAVFGSQALDGALREMRLSPVLQLGVRYMF